MEILTIWCAHSLCSVSFVFEESSLTPEAAEAPTTWSMLLRSFSVSSGADILREVLHLTDQSLHRLAPPDF